MQTISKDSLLSDYYFFKAQNPTNLKYMSVELLALFFTIFHNFEKTISKIDMSAGLD